MAKDYLNEEDVRQSKKMAKSDGGKYIRFDTGKTPIRLVHAKYGDGIVHWVKLPNGDNKKVVCLGDPLVNNGFDPDTCPICQIISDQAKEWRDLQASGRMKASAELKDKNRRMSGKYDMVLLALKGEMVYAGGTGKERKMRPSMADAEVGMVTLNAMQKKTFEALVGNPQYPQIESIKDCFNRILLVNKHDVEASWDSSKTMTVVDFIPARKPSGLPELDYDEEEMDVTQEFVQDREEATRVAMLYLGQLDEDDEVEYEDTDLSEDDFGEDDEDDFGDDDDDFGDEDENETEAFEDGEEEETITLEDDDDDDDFEFTDDDESVDDPVEEEETGFDDGFLNDVDEDVFEDDDPWEESPPAIPEPKKKSPSSRSKSSTGTSKSPSKAPATAKKTPVATSKRGTSGSSGKASSAGAKAPTSSSKPSPRGTRKAPAGTTPASTAKGTKKPVAKKKGAPKKADF